MANILVVEDDWEMNQGICYMLEKEGFYPLAAHSVEEAKGQYKKKAPDMILLDVNLPDGDGYDFLKWMREKDDIPVIFLTARDLEEDALKGYELGAEDYITKPFSIRILMKKIDLILKRRKEIQGQSFDDGFLCIDVAKGKVEIKGKECPVTPTEFRILQEFISHRGQLLTYEVFLEYLWEKGNQFVDKHALAVNMNRLRGKIEQGEHKYISNTKTSHTNTVC